MKKVGFTRTAIAVLDEIANWITQENPRRAASFVAELRAKCLALADNPQAFPIVPRYRHMALRRRAYAGFLIFYRIDPDVVMVLHVIHGARDAYALLFPD